VELLLGDPRKAHRLLKWKHKTSFRDMVKEMVASDFSAVKAEAQRFDREG
jgi:GDPmannose 4,6-dehydratase